MAGGITGLVVLFGYRFRNTILTYVYQKLADEIFQIMDQKKKERRPDKIIFVRHGESQANVDKSLYAKLPDNSIELTKKGQIQAQSIGRKLKELIKDSKVVFYVSPFKRSQQTFENIKLSFLDNDVSVKEDPRIREQEWGNY